MVATFVGMLSNTGSTGTATGMACGIGSGIGLSGVILGIAGGTMTGRGSGCVAVRTGTPGGGVAARSGTPGDGVMARTGTPGDGVAARTGTPGGGVAAGRNFGLGTAVALRVTRSCSNTVMLFAVRRLIPSRTPGVLNGFAAVVHDCITTQRPRRTGVPSASCTENDVSRPGGRVLSVETKNDSSSTKRWNI